MGVPAFIGIIYHLAHFHFQKVLKKCKQKIKMRNAAIKTIWLARAHFMGFKYTELSVTNNKEFEELVLNFNLSNLHSFIISIHFIGSAIKETYSESIWKDGEGKNKSPQKAQWHNLKRKILGISGLLQDLWLGVNTIDARVGKEFILHAATLMGNQFLA
ncbi:hypothetical protein ACJX0J_031404 [Zea mays]